MAEIKLEITDEMIKSAIREQVRAKLDKMDIKGMVKSEIAQCTRDFWRELKSEELVKQVKIAEISRNVSDIISDRIARAFEEY